MPNLQAPFQDDTCSCLSLSEAGHHRQQSDSSGEISQSRRRGAITISGIAGRAALRSDLTYIKNILLHTNARDFEEAIETDEPHCQSRSHCRSRHPTLFHPSIQAVSASNSAKGLAVVGGLGSDLPNSENPTLQCSRTSFWNRPSQSDCVRRGREGIDEEVTRSLVLCRSFKQDGVCRRSKNGHRGQYKQLLIDYDRLENFIREQETHRRLSEGWRCSRGSNFEKSGAQSVEVVDSDVSQEERTAALSNSDAARLRQRLCPQRFSFLSSVLESSVHATVLGELVMPGESFRNLFQCSKSDRSGVWWLHTENPSGEKIDVICEAFGIHPLTQEDIRTQEAREKIELFPTYYLACFRSFRTPSRKGLRTLQPFNIYVVVFRQGTLSFSFLTNPHAASVRKRTTVLKNYLALSSDWICYALIDDIVDSFAPSIREIEMATAYIEDQVFTARSDDSHDFLCQIGRARENVTGLMKLLGGKADVLKGFTKRCDQDGRVAPCIDIGLYLGDIQDHVVAMMSNLAHLEQILAKSYSNYLAQLSIDGIVQGDQANEALTNMTVLASILLPLYLVCSIWGMNVAGSFQGVDDILPFFMLLALCVFVVCLVAAKRMHLV